MDIIENLNFSHYIAFYTLPIPKKFGSIRFYKIISTCEIAAPVSFLSW